jgi:hypothetical protein
MYVHIYVCFVTVILFEALHTLTDSVIPVCMYACVYVYVSFVTVILFEASRTFTDCVIPVCICVYVCMCM